VQRQAAIGFVLCFLLTAYVKFGIGQRRKNVYCEFYRCYDDEADFERMKRVGVFQSVNPDGTINKIG
jgi:hypothetical protein